MLELSELSWKQKFDSFCRSIDYYFSSRELLEAALTHRSFANESADDLEDNQRLEFLGDAVLGLVVAEALMHRLPNVSEGVLTPRRAALVNEANLAEMARQVELGKYIRLGRGEELNNGRDRTSTLADAVEAVVGAVYLDGGYETSRKVVLSWLGYMLDEAVDGAIQSDAKGVLQETLQAKGAGVPIYRTVKEEGPDHAKIFEVEIIVDDVVLGRGRGRSKKEAEKQAASKALASDLVS